MIKTYTLYALSHKEGLAQRTANGQRASSGSNRPSYGSDKDGYFSKWSSSWSDEDSYYSGGPRSDGSWEVDSFCDSYTCSNGNGDSDYDSTSSEQSVQGYMDYDPHASDEDSDSSEDPG